jgi:WD40 repeat protein
MGKLPGSTDRVLQEFSLSGQDQEPKSVTSVSGCDLDVSSDGQMLAVGYFGGLLEVWNISDWSLNRRFKSSVENRQLISVRISPDQKYIAAVDFNSHVSIWDFSTRKLVHEFQVKNAEQWNTRIAFTPDSQRLVINNLPRSKHLIYTYTFASGKLEEHEINSGPVPGDFQVIDNSTCLIGSFGNEQIRLIDLNSWEIKESFGGTKHGRIFSVSPNRKLLATSDEGGGNIALFDFGTRKQIGRLDIPYTSISSVEFSEDGRFLAVLAIDKNNEKEVGTVGLHVWEFN